MFMGTWRDRWPASSSRRNSTVRWRPRDPLSRTSADTPPKLKPMQTWTPPQCDHHFDATVSIPGSKSATNRALVLAALGRGRSTLTSWLEARDTTLMIDGLRALGANIRIDDQRLVVERGPTPDRADIDCGLAGTVMRFLPPVAALSQTEVRFTADAQAAARPLTPMLQALRDLGADVTGDHLPFTVHGAGQLRGGTVTLDASASSQFVSGLLLSGAAMRHGLDLRHNGPPLPSMPHRDDRRDAGRSRRHRPGRGRPVDRGLLNDRRPRLDHRAGPVQRRTLPGCGNGHRFPGHRAAMACPHDPSRRLLARLLRTLGAEVRLDNDGLHVTGHGFDGFDGFDVNLRAVGELTPTIAALAACARTPSQLRGIGHLRGHETDRITAIATELQRVGVKVETTDDGLTIDPSGRAATSDAVIRTYADHRMATMGRSSRCGYPDCGSPIRPPPPKRCPISSRRGDDAPVSRRDLDEDDVRVRPSGRTRRRSKVRPDFSKALPGTVIAVDRGRFTCLAQGRMVTAVRAQHLGRKGLVVGDRVGIDGPLPESDDALVRIVTREPRRTELRRTADDTDPTNGSSSPTLIRW